MLLWGRLMLRGALATLLLVGSSAGTAAAAGAAAALSPTSPTAAAADSDSAEPRTALTGNGGIKIDDDAELRRSRAIISLAAAAGGGAPVPRPAAAAADGKFPSFWFGQNAAAMDSVSELALVGKFTLAIYGWSHALAVPPTGRGEAQKLSAQCAALKATGSSARCAVYRQGWLAMDNFDAQRAVLATNMTATRGYFLVDDDGKPMANHDSSVDMLFWNWANSSAAGYFQQHVIAPLAADPHIDAIFFDDMPGACCNSEHSLPSHYSHKQALEICDATLANFRRVAQILHDGGKQAIFSMFQMPWRPCVYPQATILDKLGHDLHYTRFSQTVLLQDGIPTSFGANCSQTVDDALAEVDAGVQYIQWEDVSTGAYKRAQQLNNLSTAVFLMVQPNGSSTGSYFGSSSGWAESAWQWEPLYDSLATLGRPLARATRETGVVGADRWTRPHEHGSVFVNCPSAGAKGTCFGLPDGPCASGGVVFDPPAPAGDQRVISMPSTPLKTTDSSPLLALVDWQGALSIHAPNSSDLSQESAEMLVSPLCASKCVLVNVTSSGKGSYFIGEYNTTIGAAVKSAESCKSMCSSTSWCVQLTFVSANPAAPCVLYSSITTNMAAPSDAVQTWVKCRAGSTVAETCAHFATGPPSPPSPPPFDVPAQMLRKSFKLPSTPVTAMLYTSSTGFAQGYINGKNVAPTERLNPGRSSLDMRHWYLSHNVTEHLLQGDNAISFLVGRGWQYMELDAAASAWGGSPVSAHQATVKAMLVISFADRQPQYVATDTTWMASVDGPIVAHNIYGFEVYDARKGLDICAGGPITCEVPWATASFDPQLRWEPAEMLEQYPNTTLSEQIVPPIRQLQLNKAVTITRILLSNGTDPLIVHVFDMGQNTAGGFRLAVPAGCSAGRVITMFFSEVLYSDNGGAPRARVAGPPFQGQAGTADQSNLFGAKARAEFICADSNTRVHYEPTFTYFGYRYVELVGYPGPANLDTVQQRVLHTDVESAPTQPAELPRRPSGAVELGNPLLNSISSAVRETLISNLYSVPTDCPQRSERWGWMADGSLSAEANYLYHWPSKLYSSWLTLMQDVQDDPAAAVGCVLYRGTQGDNNEGADGKANCSGSVGIITPGISPLAGEQALPGDPSWAVAYPLVLSLQHRYMADEQLARSMFDGLRRYVGFLDWMARSSNSSLVSWKRFGDWLSPKPSGMVDEMSSAFNHAQAIRIARDTAIALGHSSAASSTAAYENAQRGFHAAYWRNSSYGNGEQAALVYALYLGSPPAEETAAVLSQLLRSINGNGTCRPCLATGILSTKWIMETLSLYGRTDVALALALKTASPSWGHMMLMNSTTITEEWTSVDETPPLSSSRNHPALASIGAWFFRWVAGLRLADNTPGLAPPNTYGKSFARTLFAPGFVTDARVPYARARLSSPHGPVASHWAWNNLNGSIRLDLSVPSSAQAEIWIPSLFTPQGTSVMALDTSNTSYVVIWQDGKYLPLSGARVGVTGASIVSPNYSTGGGDGSDLISVSVASGIHSLVASSLPKSAAKTDDQPPPARRTVTMTWKTCNDAQGCARTTADLKKDFAVIRSFGVTHIFLFCGFGVTRNGSFAVIPDPPQRWGVLGICLQASILIAATPNMSYSVMVEGPLDFNAGLQKLIHDGGTRFGAEVAEVLAGFPQSQAGGVGLQLDMERGKNKTLPLPADADFNKMVAGIASQILGPIGIAVSQCPYLSDYQQLLSSGAKWVNDMDLYHAANKSDFGAKLQVSMHRLGSGSRGAFAAGVSLFPLQNGWENTNAGLEDRLAALDAAGVTRVNIFCWPLLGFPTAAPPALVESWARALTAWIKSDDDCHHQAM